MKYHKKFIYFISIQFNKLISIANPFAASLSNKHLYSRIPIRNWKNNSSINEKTKLNEPYKLSDVQVGAYTYISTNSRISLTTIGKFCSIGPNFLCGWGIHPVKGISTAPMFYSGLRQNGFTLSPTDKIEERKTISIGNDVFIGMNVTIMDGINIGDGAIIGAGAVVSKDIPPYAIAVGCPIKIINYRFSEDIIAKLLKIKWWDWPDEKLPLIEKNFFNVNDFVEKYYTFLQ